MKKTPAKGIMAHPAPAMTVWADTPDMIRERGYMAQTDLYRNLALSRQGLYYVLKQAEGRGCKIRRSTVGKKLYLHLGDVMAALFPKGKE